MKSASGALFTIINLSNQYIQCKSVVEVGITQGTTEGPKNPFLKKVKGYFMEDPESKLFIHQKNTFLHQLLYLCG